MPATLQPGATSTLSEELSAILTGVAFYPIADRAFLRVSGSDAARWLNGMVTNSIQDLQPGQGNYNFLLNVQGRIQGDCHVYREPIEGAPVFLIETSSDQIDTIQTLLDKFIIMDDVELSPVSGDREGLLVVGPQAVAALLDLGLQTAPIAADTLQSVVWQKYSLDIIATNGPTVPRIEIWSDLTTILELQQDLTAAGATPLSPAALEALRILSGTPRYGTDIRNTETARDLPQETAQTHALHFSKGCYLGQEIVERIRSRGNVHRTFTGFLLTGELPSPGTTLESEGKPVGELTSVAAIPLPTGTIQLALGYIRREAVMSIQAGSIPLTYPGGTATPTTLPYRN